MLLQTFPISFFSLETLDFHDPRMLLLVLLNACSINELVEKQFCPLQGLCLVRMPWHKK